VRCNEKILVTTHEDLGTGSHSVNQDFLVVGITKADGRWCLFARSFVVPVQDALDRGERLLGELELLGEDSAQLVFHDLEKNQLMVSHDQTEKVSTKATRREGSHQDVCIQADPHHETSL
jgi:hypothetical protein